MVKPAGASYYTGPDINVTLYPLQQLGCGRDFLGSRGNIEQSNLTPKENSVNIYSLDNGNLAASDVPDSKFNMSVDFYRKNSTAVGVQRNIKDYSAIVAAFKNSNFYIINPDSNSINKIIITDKVDTFSYNSDSKTFYYNSGKFLDKYQQAMSQGSYTTNTTSDTVHSVNSMSDLTFINTQEPNLTTVKKRNPDKTEEVGSSDKGDSTPNEIPKQNDSDHVFDDTKMDANAIKIYKSDGTFISMDYYQKNIRGKREFN